MLTLEFDVENLVLLRANLERNPSLASRITLLEARSLESQWPLAADRDGRAGGERLRR